MSNLARIACLGVEEHDPACALVDPLAVEGDPLPIRRPRRPIVFPALGGVGDLADVASVGVHHKEGALGLISIEPAPKDDLTVPGRATARALVVVVFFIVSATGEHRQSHGYHHQGHDHRCRKHQHHSASHHPSFLFAYATLTKEADVSCRNRKANTDHTQPLPPLMCLLVHIQDRFRAMSYGNEHETSYLRTYAFSGGARGARERSSLLRSLRTPPLPDTFSQCSR